MAFADDGPPVSPPTPWVDATKISAANARDVLARCEDDRSRAELQEHYEQTPGAAKLARPRRGNSSRKGEDRAERDRLVIRLALTDRLLPRVVAARVGVSRVRVTQILRKAAFAKAAP